MSKLVCIVESNFRLKKAFYWWSLNLDGFGCLWIEKGGQIEGIERVIEFGVAKFGFSGC